MGRTSSWSLTGKHLSTGITIAVPLRMFVLLVAPISPTEDMKGVQ